MGRDDASSLLLAAVKKGLAEQAQVLLSAGADPDAKDQYGLSVLMWAARKGHVSLVRALVEHGANLNLTDRTGRTALHHAVGLKKPLTLASLISAGTALDCRDMHGWTAFDLAKSMDEYKMARELIRAGATGVAPDPGDISIGVVLGGPERLPVLESINRLQTEITESRKPNPWGERGHLNVVFCVAGSVVRPNFDGIRTGRCSSKKRMMMVQVAISNPDLAGQAADTFLIDSLRVAVGLAAERFCRAKIEFSAQECLMLIDKLPR